MGLLRRSILKSPKIQTDLSEELTVNINDSKSSRKSFTSELGGLYTMQTTKFFSFGRSISTHKHSAVFCGNDRSFLGLKDKVSEIYIRTPPPLPCALSLRISLYPF